MICSILLWSCAGTSTTLPHTADAPPVIADRRAAAARTDVSIVALKAVIEKRAYRGKARPWTAEKGSPTRDGAIHIRAPIAQIESYVKMGRVPTATGAGGAYMCHHVVPLYLVGLGWVGAGTRRGARAVPHVG
jgi:hypothetical protein